MIKFNIKIFILAFFLLAFIPFVNSLEINNINHNTVQDKAFILWSTNELSNSKVYYSKDTSFSNYEYSDVMSVSHSIVLSNLDYASTYNYYIESCNNNGCVQSSELFFNTPTGGNNNQDDDNQDNGEQDDDSGDITYPETFFLQISHQDEDVPTHFNSRRIDLIVETSKDAEVIVNLEGDMIRRKVFNEINRFTFIDLDLKIGMNNIEIVSNLDDDSLSESFSIEIKLEPPVVNLVKPLNEIVGDILTVSSFMVNGTTNEDVYLDIKYSKGNAPLLLVQTVEIQEGLFNHVVNLENGDGRYNIELSFRDIYGNTINFNTQTLLDSEPNTLTVNNPSSSVSYVDRARIEGETKPNSDIVIYVNDNDSSSDAWRSSVLSAFRAGAEALGSAHQQYHTVADDDGFFSIDIRLSKKYYIDEYQGQVFTPGNLGEGFERAFTNVPAWRNEIKVVSTDLGDREVISNHEIILTTCDFGGDWNIEVESISPTKINPLYVSEGVATLSFNYRLTWQGPGSLGVLSRDPVVTVDPDFQSTLHPDHDIDDEYNLARLLIPRDRLINVFNRDTKTGTVTIRLNRYDLDNLDLPIDINYLFALLKMELEYTYENPLGGQGNNLNQARGRQIHCVNIKVLIDNIDVNPFKIPGLVNATRNAFVFISETIDPVVDAATTARRITSYTAFATNAAYYIALIGNRRSCLPYFRTGFVPRDDGRIILPNECPEDDENCSSCWDSIITVERINRNNRWVNDRIFCPSIPSVQEYSKRVANKNYHFLRFPSETNIDVNNIPDLYPDEDNNVMISRIDRCIGVVEDYFGSSEKERELCRLQYNYEWGSACLFSNNMFNRSFETKNMSGNFFQQFTDIADKFCFRQNTVETNIIQVNDINRCVKACHPQYSDLSKVQTGECSLLDDYTQISYHGHRGFGSPCYYILNPPNLEPGIYYAKYDERLESCLIDPRTGICKMENDRIIIDPVALKNTLEVFPFDQSHSDSSLTKFINDVLMDRQPTPFETQNDKDKFYAQKLTEFGLGEYAFAHNNKYVTEPSRTIASSITCGCITGFEQHLKLYQGFVDLGATCMSEIMYDPNATATSCQRMFAMKLCDLLYDSIKCLGTFYSQRVFFSNDRTPEEGGIGTFFASMDSAGNQVSNNLRERYGNSVVFNNIFSERAIINSMCMAAFFSDFDAEFDQLFAAAEDMVVVDPIVMVYPSQREYMTYTPVNGLATYIYRFNTIILAGADLTYNVVLRCSNAMCGSEPCDCLHIGESRYFTGTGIQGTLRKNQELHKDFIRPITSNLRYDTVEVRYSYRNAMNELIEGKKEFPIREIGGQPPMHCQFDMISLTFLCNIQIGDRGYATFGHTTPRIKGTLTSQANYKINQFVIVEGEIQKRDLDDEDPKNIFLVYSIRDETGAPVITERSQLIVNPGLTLLEDLFTNDIRLRITPQWFRGTGLNTVSDGPAQANIQGLLDNDVEIYITGMAANDLRISIRSNARLIKANGEEFQSGESFNYIASDTFVFGVGNSGGSAIISVTGMPRRLQQGFSSELIINANAVQSRTFVLDLSLHYADESNPSIPNFNDVIFNERQERHSITFRVLAQDDQNTCPSIFQFNKVFTPCNCGSDAEECPSGANQYCYKVCRQYPACDPIRHLNDMNLLEPRNKETSKTLLSVKSNERCVCDPSTQFNSADYTGGNVQRYCYIVEEDGQFKYRLADEEQFNSDWDRRIIRRLSSMVNN